MADVLLDSHVIENWMGPREVQLRTNARKTLDSVIKAGVLPDSNVKEIKAFGSGITSAVFKVVTETSPFVVKMTIEGGGSGAEATFLEEWKKQGVRVPQVLKARPADSQIDADILIMEYIDKPILSESTTSEERVRKGISREMGRVLALMHKAKGTGFGLPVRGNETQGKYMTFRQEMEEMSLGKKIAELFQVQLIGSKEKEAMARAIDILEQDIINGTRPTLTHNDFSPGNIFSTEPITVFDPDPKITHPAIDLAYATFMPLVRKDSNPKETQEILAGYRDVSPMDDKILAAATILRGLRKLRTWQRRGSVKKIENLMQVLHECEKVIA